MFCVTAVSGAKRTAVFWRKNRGCVLGLCSLKENMQGRGDPSYIPWVTIALLVWGLLVFSILGEVLLTSVAACLSKVKKLKMPETPIARSSAPRILHPCKKVHKVTAPRSICKTLGLGGAEFHADFQNLPPQPQAL